MLWYTTCLTIYMMRNCGKIEILEKSVKSTKYTYEKSNHFFDDVMPGLVFAIPNEVAQLTFKKTATPSNIGVAVENIETDTLLMSYNLSNQIFDRREGIRPDNDLSLKSFTDLRPYLPDWQMLSESMRFHYTYGDHIPRSLHIPLCLILPYLKDWQMLSESMRFHYTYGDHIP
jgi:hypothetical protein